MSEVVDKIVEFNNAGVDAMAKREPGVAWHFFKGAAELKIAFELNQHVSFRCFVKANSFVSIAESLIAQNYRVPEALMLKSCYDGDCCEDISEDEPIVDQALTHTNSILSGSAKQPSEGLPLLYRASVIAKSYKLPEDPTGIESISGALLVYNLAIVEHLYKASNGEPVSLYHLAASMLDPAKEDHQELYRVILNNTGALYWDNNLIDAAQSTMRHLHSKIAECGYGSNDLEDLEIMRCNIENIMSPPRSVVSPAA